MHSQGEKLISDDREKTMNEWKELKVDNLPPDILTGDYEFEFKRMKDDCFIYCGDNRTEIRDRIGIIQNLTCDMRYRYRKPEHEEMAIERLSLASGLSKHKVRKLIEAVISAYEIKPEAE